MAFTYKSAVPMSIGKKKTHTPQKNIIKEMKNMPEENSVKKNTTTSNTIAKNNSIKANKLYFSPSSLFLVFEK